MRKLLLVVTAMASLALADDDDVPGRAARLSLVTGTVSFQPGSVEDWVPATLNRPMTTGDRLWTEPGARAEMHIGSAALRLNGRTNFSFLNLDDRTVQVQVSVGTLNVRLRNLADDEVFEIDTPQLALTLLRAGEYRVDVDDNGDAAVVSVRGGDAEVNAGTQAYAVRARDQLRVTGSDQPVLDRRDIPAADAFDNFCENRDRREDLSQSARYVSRDVPGYADLDNAGVWRETSGYGEVWYPSGLEAGWAPYRYGHWAWIAPWGWTWVDDAPWGYAPFHYGRWVYAGDGWGWVPGPLGPRPVYAPAMVAWVGGGGFSVGIGVGPAVGWFPLGPREVWVPGYRYSPAYIERVNVTNTVIVNRTVINNVNVNNATYMNRNVAGAVTVVPQSQMVAGRAVGRNGIVATPRMMQGAQVQDRAQVAPDRTAVLGARGGVATPVPPASVNSRPIMARQAPPPALVPFQQQQGQLQQNGGQPIPRSQMTRGPQGAGPGGGGQAGPQGGAPGGGQNGTGTRPGFRQVGPQGGGRNVNVNPGGGGRPQPGGPAPGGPGPGGPAPGGPAPGGRGPGGPTPRVAGPGGPGTGGPAGPTPASPTPAAPAPAPSTVQPRPRFGGNGPGGNGPGGNGPGGGPGNGPGAGPGNGPGNGPSPVNPGNGPGTGTRPQTRSTPPSPPAPVAPAAPAAPPSPNTPNGGGGGKQNPRNETKQGGKKAPPKDDKGKEH